MKRLYNLDYLRGLAAFGIMIYHYLGWTIGTYTANTFMGRLGIYGVSIFYILSGLTLYYVYYNNMKPSKEDVLSFLKKRVFRIYPLLWLVTIITIILSKSVPNFTNLLFNLSGLFGFIAWNKDIAGGVWSIGNELVFYVFFVFFVLFMKSYKTLMMLLSLAILVLYLYFAFVILQPDITLNEQWKNYANPLNQVFLFLGGFLLGIFFHNIKFKNAFIITLLLFAIGLFTFYPATGDVIKIVIGLNRLVFTVCCFIICTCFYKLTLKFPAFIHTPLTLLGEASYSVYLLHPIVWRVTGVSGIISRHIFFVPVFVSLILSVLLTLIISYYVYQYFEKYFIKRGHTNKNIPAL